MCRNGFRQHVDLHALERRGGVDEPLHLFHLIGFGEGRRLKLVVDLFFRLGRTGEARARIERHRGGSSRGDYFSCHQFTSLSRNSCKFNSAPILPDLAIVESAEGFFAFESASRAETRAKIAMADRSRLARATTPPWWRPESAPARRIGAWLGGGRPLPDRTGLINSPFAVQQICRILLKLLLYIRAMSSSEKNSKPEPRPQVRRQRAQVPQVS